jgi:excisionase family DNA binding protein
MTSEHTNRERLLTITELSEWTGLAVGTIYHFVSQKRIPVVRLSKRCIRFRYSDLVLWISSLTQNLQRSNPDEKKK